MRSLYCGLVIFCVFHLYKFEEYEGNPFLNGWWKSTTTQRPQGLDQDKFIGYPIQNGNVNQYYGPPGTVWINVPYPQTGQSQKEPIINNDLAVEKEDKKNDLLKFCLKPIGQFPSKYCNTFINCWEGNAVEQFCPPTLVFNPLACYCDYAYNVDCQGRPIKQYGSEGKEPGDGGGNYIPPILPVDPPKPEPQPQPLPYPPVIIDDGNYKPPPVEIGPSGWPTDGSYRPPPVTLINGWPSDGSYRPPPEKPVKPPVQPPVYPPVHPPIHPPVQPPISPPVKPPIYPPVYPTPCPPHPHPHPHPYPPVVVEPPGPLPPKPPVKPTYPIEPPVTIEPPIILPPVTHPPISGLKKYCLKPRGQFPGTSCTKYVNCWDDYIIEQDCPKGLHFNPHKGYCDYPYNYPCGHIQNRQQIISHDELSDCPQPQGIFRNPTNCSNYFTCLENRVIAKYECPQGYLFNNIFGVCDLAFRVDCSAEPPNYETAKNPPKAFVDPSVPCKPGTVFRLNYECTQVAICRSGLTEIIQCPTGLFYDLESDKCLERHLAKC